MAGLALKRQWQAATLPPRGWTGDQFFTSQQGHDICYSFAPARGPHRGAIVMTFGYGEYRDLYYEALKAYQKMGYDVWAMDWYGQGRSGRADPKHPDHPGHGDLSCHVEDLHDFVTTVVKHDRQTPLVLSAHSMAGHIGTLYLEKHKDTFDGAIMSAPLLDVYHMGFPSVLRPVLRGAFRIASALGLRDVPTPMADKLWRSFNHAAGSASAALRNPLNIREQWGDLIRQWQTEWQIARPSFGWIVSTFNTTDKIMQPEALRGIRAKVLIGSAGQDGLVDNEAHKTAARLIPGARHVTIKNAHHGMWQETDANYAQWMWCVRRFLSDLGTNFHKNAQHGKTGDFGREDKPRGLWAA